MKRNRAWMLLVVAGWVVCRAALAEEVIVSEIPGGYAGARKAAQEKRAFTTRVVLDNRVRKFALKRTHRVGRGRRPAAHRVGWAAPNLANWYHGSIFDLFINGRNANTGRASRLTIAESGTRGVVDFVVANEHGTFRARFVVLPGSEVLFVEWTLEPAVQVKSIYLRLHNYPGGFAATRDGKRARRVTCQSGVFEARKEPHPFDPARDHWFFLHDVLLDKANAELSRQASGPSALVLPADEADKVAMRITSYPVEPHIVYAPKRRRFRLALLDYHGLTNKAAAARLKRERERVRQTLQHLDFSNRHLTEAKTRLGSGAGTAPPELTRLVAAFPDGGPWAKKPVTTEARAIELLQQHEKATWHATKARRAGIGVLEIRGLHWHAWQLDAAARVLGPQLRKRQVSHYSNIYWQGEDLTCFPASWLDFAQYDVIVFANVPFTVLGKKRVQALAEYIDAGGAVLLLAGTHAAWRGLPKTSPLAGSMPVRPNPPFDMRKFERYRAIAVPDPAPPFLARDRLDWAARPSALWYHRVQPAKGSNVWMAVDGHPFLVVRTVGRGRVAALCMPPYGPLRKDVTEFWQWSSWPKLVAQCLMWVGKNTASPSTGTPTRSRRGASRTVPTAPTGA